MNFELTSDEALQLISNGRRADDLGYENAYIKNGETIMGEPVTQIFAENKFENPEDEFVASISMKG